MCSLIMDKDIKKYMGYGLTYGQAKNALFSKRSEEIEHQSKLHNETVIYKFYNETYSKMDKSFLYKKFQNMNVNDFLKLGREEYTYCPNHLLRRIMTKKNYTIYGYQFEK